ncbi:MAG: hypothetical protein IKO05_09125 [Selenomonadaceae bacterium]|nr:hypothetical protein [Selenomonadaceae bacterium]
MAKEILKDEVLKDEQLDAVAGGTSREIQKDTDFLQAIGLLRQNETDKDALRRAWAQEGITVVMHGGNNLSNEYYRGGEQITRDKAMKIAMKKTGTQVNINNYV